MRVFSAAGGEVGVIGTFGEGAVLVGEADDVPGKFIYPVGASNEGFEDVLVGLVLTGVEGGVEVLTENLGEFCKFVDALGQTGVVFAPELAGEVDVGWGGGLPPVHP